MLPLRRRNFAKEENAALLTGSPVQTHPLIRRAGDEARILGGRADYARNGMTNEDQDPETMNDAEDKDETPKEEDDKDDGDEFNDPLGAKTKSKRSGQNGAQSDTSDPLTAAAAAARRETDDSPSASKKMIASEPDMEDKEIPAVKEWDRKKTQIMQRFETITTISVSTSFDILSSGKTQNRGIESRLRELEDPETQYREEVKRISQEEYVQRLRELKDEIAHAWLHSDRLMALRLSIRVAKLLEQTTVPQFYPTLFVLVTEVMDTVGRLVFNRIREKAENEDDGSKVTTLPPNWNCDDIRADAKETCRNWFYKVGSIRSVVGRIYLELAIVRCHIFMERDPFPAVFKRLSLMCRGVVDPLAASYIRTYLARRCMALLPDDTTILRSTLQDSVISMKRVTTDKEFVSRLFRDISLTDYAVLLEPPLEWILEKLTRGGLQNANGLVKVVKTIACRSGQKLNPIGVAVKIMIGYLPAEFISYHITEILSLVQSVKDTTAHQHHILIALGKKMVSCCPPKEHRLTALNQIWKTVKKYTSLEDYLSCAEVYIEFVLVNFGSQELDVFVSDIANHIEEKEVSDNNLNKLEAIIYSLANHLDDAAQLLAVEGFVNILDCFKGDMKKVVYKQLLTKLAKRDQKWNDPVVIHFMYDVGKELHDALNAMSSDDERNQIARSIQACLLKVDFGRDLEQHLSFLGDCRAAFFNLDIVKETIVHIVNRLVARTHKAVKGNHTSRTGEFVKVCLASSQITIPSLVSTLSRFRLFLETAQVALLNNFPSHAESLIKSAITVLQEVKSEEATREEVLKSTEDEIYLVGLLSSLMSFLVVMPGHPHHGPFFLLRGLLKVLDDFPFSEGSTSRVDIYCNLLGLVASLAQENLPYHVKNVDSNDTLYVGDEEYWNELGEIASTVIEELLKSTKQAKKQGRISLDVANTLLRHCQRKDKAVVVVTELIRHAQKFKDSADEYGRWTMSLL